MRSGRESDDTSSNVSPFLPRAGVFASCTCPSSLDASAPSGEDWRSSTNDSVGCVAGLCPRAGLECPMDAEAVASLNGMLARTVRALRASLRMLVARIVFLFFSDCVRSITSVAFECFLFDGASFSCVCKPSYLLGREIALSGAVLIGAADFGGRRGGTLSRPSRQQRCLHAVLSLHL